MKKFNLYPHSFSSVPLGGGRQKKVRPFYAFIPNGLSMMRLLSPLALFVLSRHQAWFWVWFIFIIAALTDWLDGFLARALRITSLTGQILDPIADKALLITTLFILMEQSIIDIWIFRLFVLRDSLLLLGGCVLVFYDKKSIKPCWIGKVSTALLMIFCSFCLNQINGSECQKILFLVLLYSVLLTTFWSMLFYLYNGFCILQREN